MVQIILADTDETYCTNVCGKLNSVKKNYEFNSVHSFDCLPSKVFCGNPVTQDSLSEFFDLKKTVFLISMPFYFKFPEDVWKIMLVSEDVNSATEIEFINKFCNRNIFLSKVIKFISDNPDLSLVPAFNGMECITGNACEKLKKGYIRKLSGKKLNEGYKVVILDLSPPYLSGSDNFSDTGHTLTDALLRIMADDFSHMDIGQYLTSTGEGILHFRPAEKADDLFECTPGNIGKLIEAVKEWIKHTQYTYYFFINCSNIPFSFIYSTAVMCDNFTILNIENERKQNTLYNNELSYLTANMPSSCTVKFECLPCSSIIETVKMDGKES